MPTPLDIRLALLYGRRLLPVLIPVGLLIAVPVYHHGAAVVAAAGWAYAISAGLLIWLDYRRYNRHEIAFYYNLGRNPLRIAVYLYILCLAGFIMLLTLIIVLR